MLYPFMKGAYLYQFITSVTTKKIIKQAIKLGETSASQKSFEPPSRLIASGGEASPFTPALYSILSASLNDNTRNSINNVIITNKKKIKLFGDLITSQSMSSKNKAYTLLRKWSIIPAQRDWVI